MPPGAAGQTGLCRSGSSMGISCPRGSWTPLSSHRHLPTHSLPRVMNGETLAAAQAPLFDGGSFPGASDLSNQAKETPPLRHPFHSHCCSGLGFKHWGLSRSPGLQLQGYCGKNLSCLPWHTAALEQGSSAASSQTHEGSPHLEGASIEDPTLMSSKYQLSYPTHFQI